MTRVPPLCVFCLLNSSGGQRRPHPHAPHPRTATRPPASTAAQPRALTIGFARRFATYKRADLVLQDIGALVALVNNARLPVQFVFAGKAHPHDEPGKQLMQRIVLLMRDPRFIGKVLFVEDYDMNVGRHLVQGVDVWLNTPRRPLEASGTSGQKVVLNGGLNLSIYVQNACVPAAGGTSAQMRS